MPKGDKLSQKQQLFCLEYVKELNGTQAAINAGYSAKTANEQASQNLAKVNIQAEIQRLNKNRFSKLEKEGKNVISELAILAFSDISDYVKIEDGGAIKAKIFEEMPKNSRRAISSIKEDRVIKENADGSTVTVHDKIEFKIWDKNKALENLGKHYALFTDRTEITGKDGGPISIAQQIEQAEAREEAQNE